jgi:hypothetical protein
VAGLLLVAGVGILAYALGESNVFAQTPAFNNTCCVQASRVPPTPGVCNPLEDKDNLKETFCPVSSGCPFLRTITTTDGGGNIVKVTTAFFQDAAIPGVCVIQGLQNCNASGPFVGIAIRRGYGVCQGNFAKGCTCTFVLAGAVVANVRNCSGSRCH